MRRGKKKIKDFRVVLDTLTRCEVGRLGTLGKDGFPMVKPLNFVYHYGKIYFHSAKAGEKIDDIRRDNRVCFEVDLPIAYVKGTREDPCKAEYLFRSVIMKGRAFLVEDDDERTMALKKLMEKYQPEGGYGDFLPMKLDITAVVKIDIEDLTGKEDLGDGAIKEDVLKALAEGRALPFRIDRQVYETRS